MFHNRTEAGRMLAEKLAEYRGRTDVIVLGLPRGGVPVAHAVAEALDAALDVFIVRKLGVPGHEELAMGAVALNGTRVLNRGVVESLGIPQASIEVVAAREQKTVEEYARQFRGDHPAPDVSGKTVILVDDGLATGASMRAAISAIRAQAPVEIVVAVPVAPQDACESIRKTADTVICLRSPEPFGGVGAWYADFSQVSTQEVRELLCRARRAA